MKAIVVLLVFMACVGCSHTDAEKWRHVDAFLTRASMVASDDTWASEGLDPFPILHSTSPITDGDIAQLWRISATFDVNSFAAPTANAVTNVA